ncbi:MAG: hypothetical protein WKG07_29195 [Hymenobacter sp.]
MVDIAEPVCRRGNPRGAGSGHRRQARRPGQRAQRGRRVESADGQRERHGCGPDRVRCATLPTWPPP